MGDDSSTNTNSVRLNPPQGSVRGAPQREGGRAGDDTHDALFKSEQRYRALLAAIPDLIVRVSADGTYLDYSPPKHFKTFVSPDQFMGRKMQDIMPWEVAGPSMAAIASALETGEEQAIQYELPGDGDTRHYEARITVSGEDEVVCIVRDITERVRSETALQESEERFRRVFSEGPLGMALVDQSFRFTRVNAALCHMLGYPETELVGVSFAEVTHPDDIDEEIELARSVFCGDVPCYQFEKRHVKKDGSIVWARLTASGVCDEGGQPVYGLVMIEDISQQLREKKLLQESEKLAAAGRMAAGIAHEINNPLAGIKNAFRLVKDAVPEDHVYQPYVDRVEDGIERIALIVRQMFDLYRPDQKVATEISLAEAVGDVLTVLAPQSRELEVAVEFTDSRHIAVDGCAPRGPLLQVLFNVIQNAIDASPSGSVVSVTAQQLEDAAVVTVADQGSGISDAVRPHVFDPFFSTKDAGPGRGLGLGLSVSRSLIEGMGGSLRFDCQEGQGTTFAIKVPLTV